MEKFIYYAPTKVIFGKGVENEAGCEIKKFGAKKVLIHYGGGSVVRSGLLSTVKQSLATNEIAYVELGGVQPNPILSLVYDGIKLCKSENVDFILAIGGGSTIDSAKAIAFGAVNNRDVWDYYLGKADIEDCLPIGTVLTIAAAGSEMSGSTVITNTDNDYKLAYGNEMCRPKFSLLNPELTFTLPTYQTFCGIVDIIMHTLERYFTTADTMNITDKIAEATIKNVIKHAKVLLNDPYNYESRAEIMWSGALSHNDLTGCGGIDDWGTHDIEHTLSGKYDIAHGAGLSALWGSWARYVMNVKPSRFAEFAVNIFDIDSNNSDLPLAGITAMESFFKSINMPTRISDMNINLNDDIIEELSDIGTFNDTITLGSFKKLNKSDLINIFNMAK